MVSPASIIHQQLASLLEALIRVFVEVTSAGRLIRAPFAMRLGVLSRVREPDLLFVSKERLGLVLDTYLDGPADAAIEIVSSESVGRDRGEKFVEYERSGVREYWLIDPDRSWADVLPARL